MKNKHIFAENDEQLIYNTFKHKWCLNILNKKINKTTFLAIPPTDGDRTDIITNNKMEQGYNYGIDCIILEIKNGSLKTIMI